MNGKFLLYIFDSLCFFLLFNYHDDPFSFFLSICCDYLEDYLPHFDHSACSMSITTYENKLQTKRSIYLSVHNIVVSFSC
ncbi:hypothetical protein AMTRI_Chr07g26270 [Amborella trichopoda]